MARYWVFLNDEVAGPYAVDQLIRLRGFSRQTPVCLDDASGAPKHWISLGEIPELAHIFKAADERHAEPAYVPKPKPTPKPASRAPRPYTPAVMLKAPKYSLASRIAWLTLAAFLAAGGVIGVSLYNRKLQQTKDAQAARALVEGYRLPSSSQYGSFPQYFEAKGIAPQWKIERMDDSLYRVSISWYSPGLTHYAFEINTQAQTVRGLNSAASTVLSEGFPPPASAKSKETAPKKTPSTTFKPSLESYLQALENGDYASVWASYSRRKKAEMAKGGISYDGFSRVQALTRRVEATKTRAIMKTKQNSEHEMLVLIKESQDAHPDVFVKQMWVYDDGAWKMDDEQKKADIQKPAPEPAVPAPTPTSLPGMSN